VTDCREKTLCILLDSMPVWTQYNRQAAE
jgi:hypothetical protein